MGPGGVHVPGAERLFTPRTNRQPVVAVLVAWVLVYGDVSRGAVPGNHEVSYQGVENGALEPGNGEVINSLVSPYRAMSKIAKRDGCRDVHSYRGVDLWLDTGK